MQVRVASRAEEAEGICSFELVSTNGDALPAFAAGSHIDIHLGNGLARQYSLYNDPAEMHRYCIAVLHDPDSRGGSRHLHTQVKAGDTLTISAPRNLFPLVHEARHSIMLAGGIGITPLMSMARTLASAGDSFELHYCTRTAERTAFRSLLAQASFAEHVHFHFDSGPSEQRLNLEMLLGQPDPSTQLYVCGPKGFMDAVLEAARRCGWGDSQVHYEFFAAAPQASDTDGAFEIEIASSGQIVAVPADKTAAQALSEAGIDLFTSCEQGVCGTCLTRVLAGEPEHRDMFLTPAEQAANDQFLPCCSRSKSPRLVLDL